MVDVFFSYFEMVRPYIRNVMVTSYKGLLFKFVINSKLSFTSLPIGWIFVNSILFKEKIKECIETIKSYIGEHKKVNSNLIIDLVSAEMCDIVKYFAFQNHYIEYIEVSLDQRNFTLDILFGFNKEIENDFTEYNKVKSEIERSPEDENIDDELEDLLSSDNFQDLKDVETKDEFENYEIEKTEELKSEFKKSEKNKDGIPLLVLNKIKENYIEFVNDSFYFKLRRYIKDNFFDHQLIIDSFENWDNLRVKNMKGDRIKYLLTFTHKFKSRMKSTEEIKIM